MTNAYPKRLIEVDLPIARISAHARREKSIRHGHISTLHIWWARRPLAACRAVMCASLWPDPVDLAEWAGRGEGVSAGEVTIRPQRFLSEARDQMARRANHHLAKASADSLPRLFATQKDQTRLDDSLELRNLLLDFIADFANWDNSTDSDYLATARALTQAAHEALGGEPGTKPLVVDPFAGGGSIPLEALRVGADAFASDLNPVAVLLNKVSLEYVPRYGQELVRELSEWGEWVKKEAVRELAEFYPEDSDGAKPIAYLWARTIISGAPGETIPVEVPLVRSMWLAKRPGRRRALRWQRDDNGAVQVETLNVTYADGVTRKVRRPLLEVFTPDSDASVEAGTVAKGSATCPVTAFTMSVAEVRAQLNPRHGGASDARLLCVVTTRPGEANRHYREPNRVDLETTAKAEEQLGLLLQKSGGVSSLTELVPTDEPRRINIHLYGMTTWRDLFTPRQMLTMLTVTELVRSVLDRASVADGNLGVATTTCLAMAVDRLADYLTSLTVWASGGEFVAHTFGRQALPIVWEWAEVAPLGDSSGNFGGALEWVLRVVRNLVASDLQEGVVHQASATDVHLASDSAGALVTDPPYYSSVPYADLSDFFYVWLKRTLAEAHPHLLDASETPKAEEIIQNLPHSAVASKQKTRGFFETGIQAAFAEARRVVAPSGIAVVVFAHTETAAWEAFLNGVVQAGWMISGSWPIDTERAARVIAHRQSTLASSIHLVCRPRENPDGSLREDVGEWREVLSELPVRAKAWMSRLASEGVVGADAIFACLGPALEIFSRYSRVEKASGETVALREYLEQVWAAVSREALAMIFDDPDTAGLEPDARLTAMWLWTLGAGGGAEASGPDEDEPEGDEQGVRPAPKTGGYVLEFDSARKIAQGLGISLVGASSVVEVKGDKARLLSVAERTRYVFGKDVEGGQPANKSKKTAQMDLFAELQAADAAMPGTTTESTAPEAGRTILDRVHQSMILFAAGRGEALKRFLVDDGVGSHASFWILAQALSALYPSGSDDKRWVDGVLSRKKGLGL